MPSLFSDASWISLVFQDAQVFLHQVHGKLPHSFPQPPAHPLLLQRADDTQHCIQSFPSNTN
jgi:hypothetical protein